MYCSPHASHKVVCHYSSHLQSLQCNFSPYQQKKPGLGCKLDMTAKYSKKLLTWSSLCTNMPSIHAQTSHREEVISLRMNAICFLPCVMYRTNYSANRRTEQISNFVCLQFMEREEFDIKFSKMDHVNGVIWDSMYLTPLEFSLVAVNIISSSGSEIVHSPWKREDSAGSVGHLHWSAQCFCRFETFDRYL